MFNIASYQEGLTDGRDAGKQFVIEQIKQFYNDNYEPGAECDFLRGYNLALDHLIECIKEMED